MEFNPSKCKIVTISHKNNPPQRKYVVCCVKLEQGGSFPYLGVTDQYQAQVVSPCFHDRSLSKQIVVHNAMNLWNYPRNVREIAYTSLARPKLEYASAAWDPFLKKDISALERVQGKAARFCSQNYNRYASVMLGSGYAGDEKKTV